jgi:hypothetical protein
MWEKSGAYNEWLLHLRVSTILWRFCMSARGYFFVGIINSWSGGIDCAMFAELFCEYWVTQEGLLFSI